MTTTIENEKIVDEPAEDPLAKRKRRLGPFPEEKWSAMRDMAESNGKKKRASVFKKFEKKGKRILRALGYKTKGLWCSVHYIPQKEFGIAPVFFNGHLVLIRQCEEENMWEIEEVVRIEDEDGWTTTETVFLKTLNWETLEKKDVSENAEFPSFLRKRM